MAKKSKSTIVKKWTVPETRKAANVPKFKSKQGKSRGG